METQTSLAQHPHRCPLEIESHNDQQTERFLVAVLGALFKGWVGLDRGSTLAQEAGWGGRG